MKATFHLTVNGDSVLGAELDSGTSTSQFAIRELQRCGFVVHAREPDHEYRVCVGDIVIDKRPIVIGKEVYWEDWVHVESAAGPVLIHLYSRTEPAGNWHLRTSLEVVVVPEKLGYSRYLAMIDDLRNISEGLVFDLISKSHRSLQLSDSRGWGISFRAAHLELRVLEILWEELCGCLYRILAEPVTALKVVRERCNSWGSERVSPTGIRELAVAGVDPRRGQIPVPFSTIRERLHETNNTPEHQIIAGFLSFLRCRIVDCRIRAEASIDSIEQDRATRDIPITKGPTLYETNDLPRLRVLEHACQRARQLESRVAEAQRLDFLLNQPPSLREPTTPVFDHVRPYFDFRNAMLRYLQSSLVVLDAGLEERVKSTHRMYEQWVFLKIASALRAGGLRCESYTGLLRRTGAYRFTFDLERNTTIIYRGRGDRVVRLRYEPYIYSLQEARERGETVYRGLSGDTPWCPDVMIEFCAPAANLNEPLIPEYVVIMDAKYSRHITEDHWSATGKYRQIRAVHDNSTVVKQLWLVYPSEVDVVCRDPAVEWNERGPNRPKAELVEGTLGMLPPMGDEEVTAANDDSVARQQGVTFVSSLLTYLEFRDGDPLHNASTSRAED